MRMIVVGAGGRMGRMLVKTISETPGAELAAAIEAPGSPALGRDAGVLAGLPALGVPVLDDVKTAFGKGDVVLDFTVPAATVAFTRAAAEAGIAHVIGTTGLNMAEDAMVREAAAKIAIVKSGNMSLGVNLLAGLVRRATKALGTDWDIEVVEMHHRMKIDAPSGTALLLGEAAAEGRGTDLPALRTAAREGHTGARKAGTIGFSALRGGTVVGDHDVILAGAGERILLGHRAEDRGIFARGAVTAAMWLKGQPPGLYSMADVLGLGG